VELQKRVQDLGAAGTRLFAISYDSVDVLARFAGKYGITFPLLSDEGSHVIRRLGLYNEHLAEQARFYGREARPDQYGVPYPGIFRLDAAGTVIEKEFEQSYRVRPSPELLVERAVSASPRGLAGVQSVERNGIVITAGVDSETFRPYEKHELRVALDLPAGLHLYGSPLPADFIPLAVSVAPFDGLDVDPVVLPEPKPRRFEGIEEDLPVYERRVETRGAFNIVPFLENASIAVTVSYQACTDTICYPPESVTLEVALVGVDLIRD